ncbi:MAG: (Fe-S)-binding protein [Candidatus Sumerlaeota bacterium]|nr:(Fe-S)-binding protein [Candidatus Sumerlaeota bacterium]
MAPKTLTAADLGPKETDQAYLCAKCGMCLQVCPTYQLTGREAMCPRGRVQLLRGLLESRLELTDNLRDMIYTCCGCNACYVNCPSGVDVEKLINEARAAMRAKGVELPAGQEAMRSRLADVSNPFGLDRAERAAWLPPELRKPRTAETCLFMGCSISFANNKTGKTILRILEKAGVDFMLLGEEEECCGDPLVRIGETQLAEAMIERNQARFRRYGVRRIVTPCAGCVKSFRRHYGGFESRHLVEWIADLIDEGQIKPRKPVGRKVIYFDGCDMGRQLGIYEPPRRILRAIPGIELIEYDKSREFGQCCGGPLISYDPEMASAVSAQRVAEAAEKGAETIAAACPTCFLNLRSGGQASGQRIDVQDVMALLYRSLKGD